jgi:hypothetical protein
MPKRRKTSKDNETAVLTHSGRRCCLCFGLHHDAGVKRGQIAHVDDDPSNNDPDNLAWLCLDHHAEWHARTRMTKGFKAAELKTHRESLYHAIEQGVLPDDDGPPPRIIKLHPTFNTTTGDKSTVINAAGDVNYTVRAGRKPPAVGPPPDAIGSSIEMRSYIEYLTKRYIDWRQKGIEGGIDRRQFHPSKIHQLVAQNFGARTYLVPQSRFADLIEFLQAAIDNTIWGKNSRHRNYHSFNEHREQVRGKGQ